ncbi:hypothetical protein FRC11_001588, partial [Ceratobasidium sp. 423]
MPAMPSKVTAEETIAQHRKSCLVGTFKVWLSQIENHKDQRALDQAWVDELAERIGNPEVLNRALHPISVILKDDTWVKKLSVILENRADKSQVPDLPKEMSALVFSGQHRVEMLAQLGLQEPEALWWHADVYKSQLETQHPAEFLTMMHESNTPQIMKPAQDVDLFRAVVKLKGLLEAKVISWESFLQNRRALIGFDKNIFRSISSLTHNKELADAIMEALSRAHIADVFSAGSWRRLATGRMYMVAAGLVSEMTAQVDLLVQGMREVPREVLSLQPSRCKISTIQSLLNQKKKPSHPWEVLPGGTAAALARVRVRPDHLVTNLNPKKGNPWSMPELVLLPSCLGGSAVEDELKLTQKLVQHLLKMIVNAEDLKRYTTSLPDTQEADLDHPAAMVAQVLQEIHKKSPKDIAGYENKVLHNLWTNRVVLHKQLDEHKVPQFQDTTMADYEHLLRVSKPWWQLLRIFKTPQLPFGLKLVIPREFALEVKEDMDTDKGALESLAKAVPGGSHMAKRSSEMLDSVAGTSNKRQRVSKVAGTESHIEFTNDTETRKSSGDDQDGSECHMEGDKGEKAPAKQ